MRSFTDPAAVVAFLLPRAASGITLRRFFLFGLFGSALVGACAAWGPTQPSATRYRGLYVFGFETSSFVPDGAERGWWVEATPEARQALHAAAAPIRQPNDAIFVHAEVEGELSPPGQYGHLGAFERRLMITRVISATVQPRPAP